MKKIINTKIANEVLEFERTKEKILVERQKAVRFKGAMLFTPEYYLCSNSNGYETRTL